MNNHIEEAQQAIQLAYNIDIGKADGTVDVRQTLETVGAHNLHHCYYVGGIAQIEDIRQHIRQFPEGQLVGLLQVLKTALSEEYKPETLETMYGLA